MIAKISVCFVFIVLHLKLESRCYIIASLSLFIAECVSVIRNIGVLRHISIVRMNIECCYAYVENHLGD